MLQRDLAINGVSVCLSVCLSHADIDSKLIILQNTERSLVIEIPIGMQCYEETRQHFNFRMNVFEIVVDSKLDVTDGAAVGRTCCIHVKV